MFFLQNTEANDCIVCGKRYTSKSNLLRHVKTIHKNILYQCSVCQKKFQHLDLLSSHWKDCHKVGQYVDRRMFLIYNLIFFNISNIHTHYQYVCKTLLFTTVSLCFKHISSLHTSLKHLTVYPITISPKHLTVYPITTSLKHLTVYPITYYYIHCNTMDSAM